MAPARPRRTFKLPARKLTRQVHVNRVADHLEALTPSARVLIAREILDRIDQLNHTIKNYVARLKPLVERHAPALLEIPGCAILTAARIVGEVGLDGRFTTDAQLARHAGHSTAARLLQTQ